MIRTIAISILGFCLVSFAPAALPAIAQMQSAAAHGVSGEWSLQMTGDHFVTGNLHLSQVNDTVVGNGMGTASGGPTGKVQLSGTMNGNKLSAKWRTAKGEVGWLTLNFTADHSAFSGDWGYNGRKPNGHIVGHKAMAPAPAPSSSM